MLKLHSKKLALYLVSILFILTAFVVSNHVITNVQAETSLSSRLSGKILLQVEDNGEAWYLNPQDNKRSYLGRPHDAYNIMREEGIGITNDNLEKIPLSLDNLSGKDSDSDKLPDNFEIAIGTDPNNSDTDSDGYDDYVEVLNNYSPKGDNAKRQTIDKSFAKSHQGKIFIQVEGNGEAWYVDTIENKRHYLGRPSDAFSIMRHLGLGISNTNLNQITIREGKGIQEYNYSEPKQEQQQGEENKEEYKNHITVTTHKPELMREFSNIIHVSATINDSSGYDFKEKGFLFDYTMNKDEVLTPTLANHKEKLIDNTPGLSIEAEIDNLLPKSYPYIRAYVITAEDIVYYGNTEVLILGNTETVDSIGAPGTPPMFGGGGGGGSVSRPSEPVYYDLTYTASDNGYLATSASEVVEEPEWESEANLDNLLLAPASVYYNNYIYSISSGGFNDSAMEATSTIFKYDTNNKSWDTLEYELTQIPDSFVYSKEMNGKIYFFYFYKEELEETSNFLMVDIYNPEDDTFQNISSSIPFRSFLEEMPFLGFFGDVYEDKLYTMGQNTNTSVSGLLIFDFNTESFSFSTSIEGIDFNGDELGSLLTGGGMPVGIISANNSMYIIIQGSGDGDTFRTTFYNLNSGEIEYFFDQTMDNMFMFPNLIEYNNNILLLGGIDMVSETPSILNSIYVYDTKNKEAFKIIDLPTGTLFSSYVFYNNRLYQIGGMTQDVLEMTEEPENIEDFLSNNISVDMSYLESYLQNINPEKIYLVEDRVEKGNDGVTVQAIPEDNYHFTSWSDGSTDNPRTDENVTSNIDVTANFAIDTYTVNYISGDNGLVTGSTTQIVNHGSSTTAVEAIPNTNYRFVDWSDSTTDNPRTDLNVTSDISVTANFEINNYDIIFNGNGGTGTMANQTITFNASSTLTTNTFTRANYTFDSWNTESDGSGTSYTDGASFTMNVEGITLYAQWEMDCGDDVTFTYKEDVITYGVVGNPDTGMCWLDRNLGATQVATASDDPLSCGDLFQWGRGDDGHQERTSNTTSTLTSGDDPGHSDFITPSDPPWDWRSPQNDNLWQGEIGINNPCPTGFRLPTSAELETERNSWSSNNSSGAFNSPLKWSVAGFRSNSGSLSDVSFGSIWSSSVSGSYSSLLNFNSSGAGIGSNYRAGGLSVRCIAHDYEVVFNANGGTGTMANQAITFNTSDNLTANSYTRANYIFTGWNTESDGSGTSYSDGSSFTMDVEGITLYAQWEMDCGDDVTFTYNGKEVTYGVIGNPDTGMCWLDRNLGADQVATASDDPDSYGDLFQWGRLDDGHQERTSNTTSTLSSGDVPGHSDLISSNYYASHDWRSPQNDNLWQGETGINNPCPTGFRLPTIDELETERLSWSSNNSSGAFNSPLKWSVAGYRHFSGSLSDVGSHGYIWSSSVSGSASSRLYFGGGANIHNSDRDNGNSVRCLRD